MTTRQVAAVLFAALIGGCAQNVKDLTREPHMTPVGAGLTPTVVAMPATPPSVSVARPGNSLWRDHSSDLFRDPRAMRVGDVVTVKILIKDKASLDNTSERSRDSKRNFGFDTSYDLNLPLLKVKGDGKIDSTINSTTSSKGEGAITRSESIDLLVAAVVTDVLPNGNMLISGAQEVRVNFEVRVLTVAGVVRPRDIATDNTVSYDKIAEARISYGGRGRITEVQQPGWAHQIVDWLSPF